MKMKKVSVADERTNFYSCLWLGFFWWHFSLKLQVIFIKLFRFFFDTTFQNRQIVRTHRQKSLVIRYYLFFVSMFIVFLRRKTNQLNHSFRFRNRLWHFLNNHHHVVDLVSANFHRICFSLEIRPNRNVFGILKVRRWMCWTKSNQFLSFSFRQVSTEHWFAVSMMIHQLWDLHQPVQSVFNERIYHRSKHHVVSNVYFHRWDFGIRMASVSERWHFVFFLFFFASLRWSLLWSMNRWRTKQ